MDSFTREDLAQLIKTAHAPCISIYHATKREGGGRVPDVAGFKNLLREAENSLAKAGASAEDTKSRMAGLEELLDNRDFWSSTFEGLAVFSGIDGVTAWRLPAAVADRVVVGSRFHILPLIPLVSEAHRFYLLALSQNSVKFFQGDRAGLRPLHVEGMPANLAEALQYYNIHMDVLFRSTTSHGNTPYAGRGAAIEEDTENLERFVRPIIQSLERALHNDKLPIVVASTARLAGALREFGAALPIAQGIVRGNADRLSEEALHKKAWAVLAPVFLEERRRVVRHFADMDGTGRVSTRLEEILQAAEEGRIDTLLLEAGAERWGSVNPSSWAVSLHARPEPGDEELLDRAAAATLGNRGQVWVLPKEEFADLRMAGSPAGSIYRY
jgi:release factor family 3